MKQKILLASTLAFFILTLASCGGPESDQKKLFKKYEKFTELANEASADDKLDQDEIDDINKLIAEMDELEKEFEEDYKNDDEAQELLEAYFEENKEEISDIYDEFYSAMMKLYTCEGSDKLEY